jgi:hypothetical protein
MNEYTTIEKQIRIKLVELGKRPCDLAKAMGVSQTLLWSRWMKGLVKSVSPSELANRINEGLKAL